MKTVKELTKLSTGKDLDIVYPIKLYDKEGKDVYYEDSNGYWQKYEYNRDGKQVYREDSCGYWWRCEYSQAGKAVYFKDSTGYWEKFEYDRDGKQVYFENSEGDIDDRREPVDLTMEEVCRMAGKKVRIVE